MLIGGHFPISKGLKKTVQYVTEAKGNTLQIFSKNPGQWKAKVITPQRAEEFIKECRKAGINPVIIHDSYLINLATADKTLYNKSIKAFVHEIERADMLGAGFLVTHMGAHKDAGEEKGLALLADAVKKAIQQTPDSNVMILLETTAGQGSQLGYKFEHIAEVIARCKGHERIGACLDTCHIFAAGYDISTDEGYKTTIEEFDQIIGLEKLKAIHLNDAKKPLASRVDRHAHIGKGHLGLKTFERIVNDQRLKEVPLILETPQPEKMHKEHIKTLKRLVRQTQKTD